MLEVLRSLWRRAVEQAQATRSRTTHATHLNLEVLEDRTVPTIFTVTTLLDGPVGVGNANWLADGAVSLREAITAASTNQAFGDAPAGEQDGDVINFDNSLTAGPIDLDNTVGFGDMDIVDDLTINGLSAAGAKFTVNVKDNGSHRIFDIRVGPVTGTIQTVTINDLILDGDNTNFASGDGGVIRIGTNRDVVINSTTIQNGRATGDGGAIYNDGFLTLTRSLIKSGSASDGGGVYNDGFATVSATTFQGNSASLGFGGGIENASGTFAITQCLFVGNSASRGGGIDVSTGTVNITNSTITGNSAANGGGLNNGSSISNTGGFLNLYSCTVSSNTVTTQGGGARQAGTGTITANNTIFADNVNTNGLGGQGIDFSGLLVGSYNIIEEIETSNGYTVLGTNNVHGDPQLQALANNGGGTQTQTLGPLSPALGSGDPNSIGVDQRGVTRGAVKNKGAVDDYEPSTRSFASLKNGTTLVLFDDNASTPDVTLPVTGLLAGENLLGIDLRPSDGKVYGLSDQYRLYTINLSTGAATYLDKLAYGLNDGAVKTFDQTLGLYVDEEGYFQSNLHGGADPKWIRGANNAFGNPWYILRLNNAANTEFLAWDGVSAAATQTTGMLATLSGAVFADPKLLYDAFSATATLSGGDAALALTIDSGTGLYVDVGGLYQPNTPGGGDAPKWIRGNQNLNPTPWFYLKISGGNTQLWSWGSNISSDTLLQTFTGTTLFLNPELLYNAVKVGNAGDTLSSSDKSVADILDTSYGFYVDEQGYFQSIGPTGGGDPKWIRGVNNIYGNPWYILRKVVNPGNPDDTQVVAWDGTSPAATQIATSFSTGLLYTFTGTAVFSNPELLFKRSSTGLVTPQNIADAQHLDNTLGLYVDEQGFFQSNVNGGGDPKWLRGANNAYGNPWYIVRLNAKLNTEVLAWDGVSPAATQVVGILSTFIGTAGYRTPELIYEASNVPIGTGLFNSPTDTLSIHFNPITGDLRLITSNNFNYHVNVDNGDITRETSITPASSVGDIAFTGNLTLATAPLYLIDFASDSLLTAANPRSGAVTSVGSLGVDTTKVMGFDIYSGNIPDLGYAILQVGGTSKLYMLNLATGAATLVPGSPTDPLLATLYNLVVLS